MRILVITQYFYPENLRINDLCNSLSDKGHVITVLTGKPNYPKGTFFEGYSFFKKSYEKIHNIDVYRANLIPRGSGNGFMLFLNYTSFVFFGFFKLFKLKGKFDKIIIYAPSPITVGYLGIIAGKLFNAKSFLWVHDLWPESVKVAGGIKNKFILRLVDLMTRSIYSNYKTILIQSPSFKNYLINQSVPKNKIIYYPYYAESFYKKVDEIPSIKKLFPTGINILFAGNIGVAQDFDTIIEASIVARKNNKKFNIIVLGEGRDKKRIQLKVKENNLENIFYFLGSFPPEKMPYFFASADALLITLMKSKIFSLTIPGKLQSYLACAKPIIGSLDGIGAKIINDASCGYVSPAGEPNMLAASITKICSLDGKTKNQLGDNARKYFNKEFEKDQLLNRLIKILD